MKTLTVLLLASAFAFGQSQIPTSPVPVANGGTGVTSALAVNLQRAPYFMSCASTYSAGTWSPVTTTVSGTLNSGSTSVTVAGSASTWSGNGTNGNGIYIAGAGAAGVAYLGTVTAVAGSVLTITPATSTTVTGTAVQHDESASLNSAITDLSNGTINGYLQAPTGICLFNGPLLNTGTANAIISLPNIAYNPNNNFTGTSGPPLPIDIRGTTEPARASNNVSTWTAVPPTLGTVFQTSGTTGNFIGANNGGETDGFTNVALSLTNLTFRTIDNPSITMVNAQFVVEFRGNGTLVFDTMAAGSASGGPSQPTHTNGQALILPQKRNDGVIAINNLVISGFYTAMTWTEHLTLVHAELLANWQGIVCNEALGSHRGVGYYVDIEASKSGIVATQSCAIYILALDTENVGADPSWASSPLTINDPSNFLIGSVFPVLPGYLTRSGGANLGINLFPFSVTVTADQTMSATSNPGTVITGLQTGTNALQANINYTVVCDINVTETTANVFNLDGTISQTPAATTGWMFGSGYFFTTSTIINRYTGISPVTTTAETIIVSPTSATGASMPLHLAGYIRTGTSNSQFTISGWAAVGTMVVKQGSSCTFTPSSN